MAVTPKTGITANLEFLRFQQNLKKTALGLNFGKKMFMAPDSITVLDMVKVLQALGLKLPDGVEITKEACQLLLSGQAVKTNYEAYKAVDDAQNTKNLCAASANTIAALTAIFERAGMIDAESAMILNVGTAVVRIVGSLGYDVTAWIQLCLTFALYEESVKQNVKMDAMRSAVETYKVFINRQAEAIGQALVRFKTGKIGIFGFIVEAADNSPALFEQAILQNEAFLKIFPGLKALPVFDCIIRRDREETTWYGSTQSDSFEIPFRSIWEMNEETAFWTMFNYAILPITGTYAKTMWTKNVTKMNPVQCAVLSLMSQKESMNQDYFPLLLKNQLMPIDLNINTIVQTQSGEIVKDNGISFGSQQGSKVHELTQFESTFYQNSFQWQPLLNDKKFYGGLRNMCAVNYFKKTDLEFKSSGQNLALKGFDEAKVSNFVAAMDMVDLIFTDPIYQKYQSQLQSFHLEFLHIKDYFVDLLNHAYNISVIRSVNNMGLYNVAYFLGTTPDKLVAKNPIEEGKPRIIGIK